VFLNKPPGVIMDKPIIRSITYFTPRFNSVEEYVEHLDKAVEKLRVIEKNMVNRGFTVFTKRISLPRGLSLDQVVKILDRVDHGDILVSIGAVDVDIVNSKGDVLVDLIERGYYTSIYGLPRNPVEYSREISRFIHRLTGLNPLNATRVAVAMHDTPLQTPYFPDSTSPGVEGLGVAFLYPKHLNSFITSGRSLSDYPDVMIEISMEVKDLIESIGFKNVLFDYSLSPWMDNSVVELLEKLGYTILKPGFNYGVTILNNVIREIALRTRSVCGFNEVMLPYAEDNELKKLGEKGVLKAHHLLLYSATCVAGPDMIIVPESIDKLAGFLLDVYSVWLVKKKPLSTRVIPVNGVVGDRLDLGRFGYVTIIDY